MGPTMGATMRRKQAIEHRVLPLDSELRAGDGEQAGQLVGHAAVFNQWTMISDWFGDGWDESVAPGAFRKTIKEADIRALWNHDPNIILGRNKAGTLKLSEDETGLLTIITPPDNEWGRPIMDAVKRGDVSGMSIAFQVIKEQWERPAKKKDANEPRERPKRTIKEAQLFDVSPVTFPAFPQTDVAARSAEGDSDDALLPAFRAARLAELGLPLEAEERSILRAAAELMLRVSEEPGSVGADEAPLLPHSPTAPIAEPVDCSHSAEARARRIKLIQMALEA
jgi:HK97 family phage prohead protease